MHAGLVLRTAMVSAVFSRTMGMSEVSRAATSRGELLNLMSNDATKLLETMPLVHLCWSAPLQVRRMMHAHPTEADTLADNRSWQPQPYSSTCSDVSTRRLPPPPSTCGYKRLMITPLCMRILCQGRRWSELAASCSSSRALPCWPSGTSEFADGTWWYRTRESSSAPRCSAR